MDRCCLVIRLHKVKEFAANFDVYVERLDWPTAPQDSHRGRDCRRRASLPNQRLDAPPFPRRGPGGLHRTRFQKNKCPPEKILFFFLCLFSLLLLETTKTLVYPLSASTNGGAHVAVNPSFRGLLSRFHCPPRTQRLGTGSSEGRRPSLHQ